MRFSNLVHGTLIQAKLTGNIYYVSIEDDGTYLCPVDNDGTGTWVDRLNVGAGDDLSEFEQIVNITGETKIAVNKGQVWMGVQNGYLYYVISVDLPQRRAEVVCIKSATMKFSKDYIPLQQFGVLYELTDLDYAKAVDGQI